MNENILMSDLILLFSLLVQRLTATGLCGYSMSRSFIHIYSLFQPPIHLSFIYTPNYSWIHSFFSAMVIALFSPLLSRIGYGLPWRNSTIMIWGGLRGAVGLTLALIVAQKPSLDETGRVQQKVSKQ